MSDDQYPTPRRGGDDRPLDESVISMLAEPVAPTASPEFWNSLDDRLESVDAERFAHPARPGPGLQAIAETESDGAETPVGANNSLLANGHDQRRSSRWGYIAAAAVVVIAVMGAVWAVARFEPSPSPADGAQLPIPSVLQADEMTPSGSVEAGTGAINIWVTDYIEGEVIFPADGNYEFVVVASGLFPRFPGPALEVRVDFITVGDPVFVEIDRFSEYRFTGFVEAGPHQVSVVNSVLSNSPESDDEYGSPGLEVVRIEIRPVEE